MSFRDRDEPRSVAGKSTDEMVRDIWEAIYGDGSEYKPGLLIRLDRTESKLRLFSWFAATAVGAAVVAAISSIWSHLNGGR